MHYLVKKQLPILFLFTLLLCPSVSLAQKYAHIAKAELASLISSLPENTSVAFPPFKTTNKAQSEFCDQIHVWLESQLLSQCQKLGHKMVERQALNLIINEWKLNMSGITDADPGAKMLIGANIVITGNIIQSKATARVHLKAVNLETGQIINSVNFSFNKTLAECLLAAPFDAPLQLPPQNDAITIWSNQDTYSIGDNLVLKFSVNSRGYVTIVDINPRGEKTFLFPNTFQPDNFCLPEKVYSLPAVDSDYSISSPNF